MIEVWMISKEILVTNKSKNVIREILNFGEMNGDLNGVRYVIITVLNKIN